MKENKWSSGGNRPRILFDMDDVVTNFLNHLVKIYNDRKGTKVKISDIKGWNLGDALGQDAYDIFKEDGFFLQLKSKKKSTSTLKSLIESEKYDIYIVTACTRPEEFLEKVFWFREVLPSFNTDRIISTKEKYLIRGDVIVDDKVANLDTCAPYMECILYDMPSNRNETRYKRIKNLEELIPILEEMFY